ncbi:hypothetical protein [Priestia aryabhattai]|uniref:hypothetical protein n=1 Tax=Priestia aryabhattai TaxID=412384 RepID=UPI0030EDAB0F
MNRISKKITALICILAIASVGIFTISKGNDTSSEISKKTNALASNEVKTEQKDLSKKQSSVKVIEKNKEITDMNVLYQRAKKGESEFIDADKFNNDLKITNVSNDSSSENTKDESLKVDNYQTSQLLEKSKTSNGDTVETYVINNFADVSEVNNNVIEEDNNTEKVEPTNESKINTINLSNNQNKTVNIIPLADKGNDTWDSTIGVNAYSRIYITVTTDSKGKWYDLQKVTGGWKIVDDRYTLSGMSIRMAQVGVGKSTSVNKKVDYKITTKTFSKPAPSSWPAVSASTTGAGKAIIGASQYATIHRGSTTWKVTNTNNW